MKKVSAAEEISEYVKLGHCMRETAKALGMACSCPKCCSFAIGSDELTKKEYIDIHQDEDRRRLADEWERLGAYLEAGFTEPQADILRGMQEQIYKKADDISDY